MNTLRIEVNWGDFPKVQLQILFEVSGGALRRDVSESVSLVRGYFEARIRTCATIRTARQEFYRLRYLQWCNSVGGVAQSVGHW
jgi:hypothetical protein